MKTIFYSWRKPVMVIGLIAALSVFTSCKEQLAGGGSDDLENKVLVAEQAVEELRSQIEALQSDDSDSPASQAGEIINLELQVGILKEENERISKEVVEFKRSHPLPD